MLQDAAGPLHLGPRNADYLGGILGGFAFIQLSLF